MPVRVSARPAVLLLLLAGCAASGLMHSRASQPGMPCTEAARVARGALTRLAYESVLVTPPAPGTPGTIVGKKPIAYDGVSHAVTRYANATVTITCSNTGATFEAATDEPLPGSLTFKSDFASAIAAVAARHEQRPRLASRPETGIVITVEPLRSGDARAEFDVDLPAAGVTPVRLRIENRSERTYTFAPRVARLVTQEGVRAKPLSAAAVATRAGVAPAPLQEKQIGAATLPPAAAVAGFLYFPASAYRRATIVLIDQASEEEEGFSVEF